MLFPGGYWEDQEESSEDELSEFCGLYNSFAADASNPADVENDKTAAMTDDCHVLKESLEFSGICAFCKCEDTIIDFDSLQVLLYLEI